MKRERELKALTVFLAFLLFIGLYSPQAKAERFEEKFEKTVPLAKDGLVSVGNVSGSIEVRSWKRAEVKIEAVKIIRASSRSEADEKARLVEIVVEKEDNAVSIETEYPRFSMRNVNVSVNYSLMVPESASVKMKTVSGDITLEDIGGSVKAGTTSGSVRVKNAKKGVDCGSISGNVTIENVVGDAYLNAISGEITVRQIQGSVEAKTVSGGVELVGVSRARTVKVNVLSGGVVYEGDIMPDGRYELKSHSGSVEVTIPFNSAFDLEAKTFSGRIHSDFEIRVSGTISKSKLQGEVNGGGAELSLTTFSGSIYLKKK